MSSTDQKIDNYLRKQRIKDVLRVVGILLSFSLVLALIYTPHIGKQEEVSGVVITLSAHHTDNGHRLYMLVELETGIRVNVFIPNSGFYKQGGTVNLLKVEPMLFGKTVYKYKGYTA